MNIAIFGSSLVSAYRNSAATYFRGMIRALHARGHHITFYEADDAARQKHRDIEPPEWANSVVYEASEAAAMQHVRDAASADVIVKTSGMSTLDMLLNEAVLAFKKPANLVIYWDVDAPATLDRLHADSADPLLPLIPKYDMIFTRGGGDIAVRSYKAVGARACEAIYNGLDPSTHHPVPADERFASTVAFLGNRLLDREARVKDFLFTAARMLPRERFLLAGEGWPGCPAPANVAVMGHLGTRYHNAFNSTPQTVLNISRTSMAKYGYSPAARIFEAAGAAACIVSDDWEGMEHFFEPDYEILVARDGEEVADLLDLIGPRRAREIGNAAFRRVLSEHTYAHRAAHLESVLEGSLRAAIAA